jgi:hypothetical protein
MLEVLCFCIPEAFEVGSLAPFNLVEIHPSINSFQPKIAGAVRAFASLSQVVGCRFKALPSPQHCR